MYKYLIQDQKPVGARTGETIVSSPLVMVGGDRLSVGLLESWPAKDWSWFAPKPSTLTGKCYVGYQRGESFRRTLLCFSDWDARKHKGLPRSWGFCPLKSNPLSSIQTLSFCYPTLSRMSARSEILLCHKLSLWLWPSCFVSLYLSFPIRRMRRMFCCLMLRDGG